MAAARWHDLAGGVAFGLMWAFPSGFFWKFQETRC
jgi:hypothetical protein